MSRNVKYGSKVSRKVSNVRRIGNGREVVELGAIEPNGWEPLATDIEGEGLGVSADDAPATLTVREALQAGYLATGDDGAPLFV